MPTLEQLHIFVLTIELKSIARAAEKLGVSPAAISKQLTRLEDALGVQLMLRSTRKIELTDMGVNYLEQCLRVIEEYKGLNSLISHVKNEPEGRLKVVAARLFGKRYIVPYVEEFLKKYPKIQLNLELAERMPNLKEEGVDILIGMSLSAPLDTIQKKIMETKYVMAASPAYLKKWGVPKNPKDLVYHRYITHSMRKPDNEMIFRQHEVIKVEPYLRVNDVEAMIQFAKDGIGIVKLHQYALQPSIDSGELQEVLSGHLAEKVPLYVAYPERRYISSNVKAFMDFFLKSKYHA